MKTFPFRSKKGTCSNISVTFTFNIKMFPLSFSSNDKICYLYVYLNFCKQEIYFRLQNGISCANKSLKFNIRRKERACTNLPRKIKKTEIYSCSQMFLSLFIERDKYWPEINRTFSYVFYDITTAIRLKKNFFALYPTWKRFRGTQFYQNRKCSESITTNPQSAREFIFLINNFIVLKILWNYFSIKIINRIIVPIYSSMKTRR